MTKDELLQMTNMVRYATMAPSPHNTRPWKFSLHEDEIRLRPDFSRRLPVSDPENRELFISLGCALENLVIAMCHHGYRPELETPSIGEDFLRVRLGTGPVCADPSLFSEIAKRQTCRTLFRSHRVSRKKWAELRQSPSEPGVLVQYIEGADALSPIADLVVSADNAQLASDAYRDEVLQWIRPNVAESHRHGDGLAAEAIGVPSGPRWLGRFLAKATALSPAKIEMDRQYLLSSPGLILFSSSTDEKLAWINVGRSLERFLLKATALNLKTAFLNQPIEIPFLRAELRKKLRLDGMWPQIMVRVGYSKGITPSRRRPVEDVIEETPDTLFARPA